MHVFLETERLVLRRFSEDDVGNLVELDSDPDVMRFINGGRPTTPRHEIENDILPAFLEYTSASPGMASARPCFTSPGPTRSKARRKVTSSTHCSDRSGSSNSQPRRPSVEPVATASGLSASGTSRIAGPSSPLSSLLCPMN